MAAYAEFAAPIFYRKILPFLDIRLPVPAIHIPSFIDSEIIGRQEGSGD